MTDSDPALESAAELTAQVRDGGLTAVDAIETSLDRIARVDDEINAFVTVTDEQALEAAEDADIRRRRDLEIGLLHGVPIALKDLWATKAAVPHTFGSAPFSEFVAPESAAIVERLEDAGAIVVGKTNTPEFGHTGTTDNELVGATASPIDTTLNAGGSSGGSAAAVAAGMVPLATGSDAGGSIRIPAAACNVYGLKPSYGLVPNDTRPNAFGTNRHHVAFGTLSRTVQDAALALDVMSGYHADDPASFPVEIDALSALGRSIDTFDVAYSPDLDVFPIDNPVHTVVEDALSAFEAAGATVEEIDVDHGRTFSELEEAVVATFATEVASSVEVIRRETGIDVRDAPESVSDSLLALLDAGAEYSATDVATTGPLRTDVFDAVEAVFEEYELLVTPTVGRADVGLHEDLGREAWEIALTWPFNWTGHPVASIPAGLTDEGSPVGLQIVGPRYNDETVIGASAAFERERPWHQHYPDRPDDSE
jgi:aspartyl-tRNA(Asn)/glutamyl-tRNA(Gln) amidotransferase subunit A